MNQPIQIEIKGAAGAGKTMLLWELVSHLSAKGFNVRGFDDTGEVNPKACKPIHDRYEAEPVCICTRLERVSDIGPSK